MGNFKPDSFFEQSINRKDMSAIKTCLKNVISADPLFKTTDFEDACKYVRNKGIPFDEEYQLLQGETTSDKAADWTKDYFFGRTEYLRMNFAIKERLPHIKEVGQVAFKENFTQASQPHPAVPKGEENFRMPNWGWILLALLAVVAVMPLIIRFLKQIIR